MSRQSRTNEAACVLLFLALVLIVLASPCRAEGQNSPKPLKVGFLYPGTATDMGWDASHDQGRRYLETSMRGSVTTVVAESVPENAEVERVMEKMIAQGTKIIFAASYGYFEPAVRVATRHPDVTIKLCGRMVPQTKLKNIGSYFVPYYEPLYAAGIVAARMTKTNNIGFVAGFPVSNVICGINAFTLGARSIKPNIKVHVVWTSSWGDTVTEAEATRALVEQGSDVIGSTLNTSLNVAKAAEKAKAFSIGTSFDLRDAVPNSWLTGQVFNWGPLCLKMVKSVAGGTAPPDEMHPIQDGYVGLGSFGKSVPKPVQDEALKAMKEIKDGKRVVFQGPLKDQKGNLQLAKGQTVDGAWLDKMNWFVPGVDGKLSLK